MATKISNLYNFFHRTYSLIPKKFLNGIAFPPLRIGLVITHRCNLKCAMCFVWECGREADDRQELTTDEIYQLVKQIPRFSIITLTGGEPLVRKDIDKIIEITSKRKLHLVTNGTLLNQERIEFLLSKSAKRLWNSGLVSVGISLEGPEDLHDQIVQVKGAFKRTVDAISLISELKRKRSLRLPILDLKVVITKKNFRYLTDMYKLAYDKGMEICSFQLQNNQRSSYGIDKGEITPPSEYPPPLETIDPSELKAEITKLLTYSSDKSTELRFNPPLAIEDILKHYQNKLDIFKFTCNIAWTTMHIGPYGDVYPCFSISMGNIREQTLKQIWNGQKYCQFRSSLIKSKIFPGCIGCCVLSPD